MGHWSVTGGKLRSFISTKKERPAPETWPLQFGDG